MSKTTMVVRLIAGHVRGADNSSLGDVEVRLLWVKHEVGERCMVPKNSVVLDIQDHVQLFYNVLGHFCVFQVA